MTLNLHRLLVSASVLLLIWSSCAGTVNGATPSRSTPTRAPRSTTTLPTPAKLPLEETSSRRETPARSTTTTIVSPARQNQTPAPTTKSTSVTPARQAQTPTTSGTTLSRRPTPSTTPTPAKQNETPSVSTSGTTTSLRPTPTRASSTSPTTSKTTPAPIIETATTITTTVSMRPTPTRASSSTAVSKRDTPTPKNVISSEITSATPFVTPAIPTSFVTTSTTPASTQAITQAVTTPSTTPIWTQPPLSSTMGSTAAQTVAGTSPQSSSTSALVTSSSAAGTSSPAAVSTTSTGPGGGQVWHVQILFCNQYSSVMIPNDPVMYASYSNSLQEAFARFSGTDPSRFVIQFMQRDPETNRLVIQFDVLPWSGLKSDEVVQFLINSVAAKNLTITDKYGSALHTNCAPPDKPIYPWTDYGPCPTQRCMNGGICRVRVTGYYYCSCPPMFTGEFCEAMVQSTRSTSDQGGGSTTTSPATTVQSPTTPSTTPSTIPISITTPSTPGTTTSSSVIITTNGGGEGTTEGGGGGDGQGPVIHVQMIFCNDYGSVYGPIDPNDNQGYIMQLQSAISKVLQAAPGRIQGLFIARDPPTGKVVIQYDIVPGPGKSTDQILYDLSKAIQMQKFTLKDMYNNSLYLNCGMPMAPMYPWTDYGPCPNERCKNGGRCKVKITGQYYCECPPQFSGDLCDKEAKAAESKMNNNLLWLLLIPAAVALLLLLLCCLLCWSRGCCCFAARGGSGKVIEIIEDDVYQDMDTRSMRSVKSMHSCRSQGAPIYTVSGSPMSVNDAGSTYYHALGRPFAVAFNDNTFSAVGYATNDAGVYTQTGRKSICGDEEIQVVMNGRGSCGSVYSGCGSGMGNKYAMRYNDRTFNTYSSMPRYDRIHHYN